MKMIVCILCFLAFCVLSLIFRISKDVVPHFHGLKFCHSHCFGIFKIFSVIINLFICFDPHPNFFLSSSFLKTNELLFWIKRTPQPHCFKIFIYKIIVLIQSIVIHTGAYKQSHVKETASELRLSDSYLDDKEDPSSNIADVKSIMISTGSFNRSLSHSGIKMIKNLFQFIIQQLPNLIIITILFIYVLSLNTYQLFIITDFDFFKLFSWIKAVCSNECF